MSRRYKEEFSDKKKLWSFVAAIGLFACALAIQAIAYKYVGQVRSIPVPDLVLDHIPSLPIGHFIIQAVLWVTLLTVLLALSKPKYLAFGFKTLALLLIIRAFLISMTHLGVNPHQLVFDPNAFGYSVYNYVYNSNNDFFFSAHTGVPLLIAFVFWDEKKWRYFYIATSIFFGAGMLIAHIHYSIDVFAAPFMTYSIFHSAKHLFRKDYLVSRN